MTMTRRGFLRAALPVVAAPAIIRVASLMRISPFVDDGVTLNAISHPEASGFIVHHSMSMWGRAPYPYDRFADLETFEVEFVYKGGRRLMVPVGDSPVFVPVV